VSTGSEFCPFAGQGRPNRLLMQKSCVEDRAWLTRRFLRALVVFMLLAGPEAMQLATYVCGGDSRHQGSSQGVCFVIQGLRDFPTAALYGRLGAVPLVQALFLAKAP